MPTLPGVRSPHDRVGGLVHFGRMIDKIRAQARAPLGPDYEPFLGDGFDGRTCRFLKVAYPDVRDHVLAHPNETDEQLLEWACGRGRRPDAEEISNFSEFMRKFGWNDDGADRLKWRKENSGLTGRDDVQTMFQYIDADEGR